MMLILDTTTLLNDGIIEIPSYHVGHLSLKSGTQVTTCLLSDKVTTAPQLYEIVVTPIVFDSWQYLTRVSATFNNQPGVVRKLTHALWKAELDILYEESASVELGRYHRVELLVDARKAYEQFDESLALKQAKPE